MSGVASWGCSACQKVFHHKTSVTRHWRDRRTAEGKNGPHDGDYRFVNRQSSSGALSLPRPLSLPSHSQAPASFALPSSLASLPGIEEQSVEKEAICGHLHEAHQEYPPLPDPEFPATHFWGESPLFDVPLACQPFVNEDLCFSPQPLVNEDLYFSPQPLVNEDLYFPPSSIPSHHPGFQSNGEYEADMHPQLRSSRSTRNQDHQAASRNRPGVVDLDPTEGLPVQKWEQVVVRVNQDPSSDPSTAATLPSGVTATSSAEWAAQFNTSQFPWAEKPLPSFFNQLPPWNQEMLRRARAGNTNAKLSVWDSKTSSWISAAEAEKRHNPLKSVHLNNVESNNGSKQNTVPDSPTHDEDDDHDEKSDDEMEGDHADDEVGPTTAPSLKRRKKFAPEERIFEVKRWVQVPSAVADKTEERKFLADRRPGMPSLYGGAYQNEVFGSMGLNTNGYGFSAANAGYDLGDGGGLGNTGGMLHSAEGVVTPVRKNMPPKRKKKKGGPGRKKANPDPIPQADASAEKSLTAVDGAVEISTGPRLEEDTTMADDENEGSESGSEAEGSEEGEIDEGGHESAKQNDQAENQTQKEPETMTDEQQIPPNDDEATKSGMENAKLDVTMSEVPSEIDSNVTGAALPDEPKPADEMLAETLPNIPPEPEYAPSTVQPTVSEQSSEIPLVEPTPISMPDQIPEISLSVPESTQPSLPPATMEPLVAAVSDPEPVPADPYTQLPPISTAVAEAVEQPSISAPVMEPVPVPSIQGAQSTNIPEPTSPDLLGGLEDALNKNMDEQSNE